ncbi:heme-copper oxidase subunit III [Hymenobacter sp. BT491]|uniref:cytochrome c oxidase subunit 3 n=1 Tax=Hymenobacter sp. BT491 TaxID=2766779 RepID=UPI001653746A|nr:cytochrome c oxidase subunit 3 [Hymenobacter sp. BT491]MBC6990089.1 cytochrome c oxidase subunit III [Hymenobacter sp. BT491]
MNSDKEHKDKVGAGRPPSAFARMERVPPLLMLLYLGMIGITVLFAILMVMYVRTRIFSGIPTGLHPFPRYFSISTIVLLVSSYTLSQARRLYQQDDVTNLARCLGATLILGLTFAGLQVLGWHDLMTQRVLFTGEASGTYVYIISALHVAHLLGGVLFLTVLSLRTLHASRDGVRTLVFIRNPYRRLQLRMVSIYWHFIDGLWVLLFAMFLFLY